MTARTAEPEVRPRGIRPPYARPRRRGMTTVEVAMAVGVLVIAMGAFLRTQVGASQLLGTARDTSIASADLQACMNQILATPHETVPVAGSPFEAGAPIAAFEELHLKDERLVATYPGYALGAVVPDPLEVVLTLSWTDAAGRPREMSLASARTR